MFKSAKWLIATLAVSVTLPAVAASTYPDRTIRLIVPYPAGGGVDLMARGIAEALTKHWGETIVVLNRPGASAMIGIQEVARASPDGYTLLMTSDSPITSNPHLFADMQVDSMKELSPISEVAAANLMVLANPELPVSDMAGLLELAASREDPITYASFGNGSQPHIFYASLANQRDLNMLHVPYKGISPSMQAVMAGDVDLAMASVGIANELVKSGRVQAFAISRSERSPMLPDVPSLHELGLEAFDPQPWFGMMAPADTPLAIRNKIYEGLQAIFDDPQTRERLITARGYELVLSSPEAFAQSLQDEFVMRGQQIELSGVSLD